MEVGIVEQLIDFGALGIFAGFLVWQFISLQKRLDKLVTDFQSQLKEINDDYDDRIDKMRIRYDEVIGGLRHDAASSQKEALEVREKLFREVGDAAKDNSHKLDTCILKLDEGLIHMRQYFQDRKVEAMVAKKTTRKT